MATALLLKPSLACCHLQARPRQSRTSSISSLFSQKCSLRHQPPAVLPARAQRPCPVVAAYGGGDDGAGEGGDRRQRGGRDGDRRKQPSDGFSERVVQVRRVTKVVKGGKLLSFRAVVIVGNKNGKVGVGCASAKEIAVAVQRAAKLAKRESVDFPLSKAFSLPHRIDGYWGAAKVMLRPAAEGAGVIAGGSVRIVLELAGVRNCFGKQLGTNNPLNNARAAIEGLRALRTFQMVAKERGIPVQELMGMDRKTEPSAAIAGAMAEVV
eukprot:CAMPEP_0206140806 /NCGR_PEP_ID=MMETSP1473-20131121/10696_1 /ASSEMBLY_ACC=CAM_ASM_001109 /TAXON_ID=1461547 /ORGANISM="Stichococcus sp, Strain RCC1054" /LENGTH=266 /DNA_ID=CAMNT_0053535095 /DNA_START=44 /DNA_END=844 /DNA_ORIENTATION=+